MFELLIVSLALRACWVILFKTISRQKEEAGVGRGINSSDTINSTLSVSRQQQTKSALLGPKPKNLDVPYMFQLGIGIVTNELVWLLFRLSYEGFSSHSTEKEFYTSMAIDFITLHFGESSLDRLARVLYRICVS